MTCGQFPNGRTRANRYFPLALVPKEGNDLRVVRETAANQLKRLAEVFAHTNPSGIDRLRVAANPNAARIAVDLWLHDVRIVQKGEAWMDDEERHTHWVLFGSGYLPPSWQGGADGVIARNEAFMLESRLVNPTPFMLIEG